MILVSFFEILDGFWSTKKLPSLLLHVNQDLLDLSHVRFFFLFYVASFRIGIKMVRIEREKILNGMPPGGRIIN